MAVIELGMHNCPRPLLNFAHFSAVQNLCYESDTKMSLQCKKHVRFTLERVEMRQDTDGKTARTFYSICDCLSSAIFLSVNPWWRLV